MIAKLIVWDTDRPAALRRLRQALTEYQVAGVTTNLGFLGALAAHRAFNQGEVDTGFIERHRAELFPERRLATDQMLALACLDVLLRRAGEAQAAARSSLDPCSPWHHTGGWRLNGDNHHCLTFSDGEEAVSVIAHYRPGGYLLELPGGPMQVQGEIANSGELVADLGGKRLRATVVRNGLELTIIGFGANHRLLLRDPYAHLGEEEEVGGNLTAPMPGKVIAIMVEAGALVKKGAPLMILEAMKMEHTINAPADGTITGLLFPVGALVGDGAQLLAFEAAEG
jgi:3-methylcrotonyl-CoA carboxylase alpha subunit